MTDLSVEPSRASLAARDAARTASLPTVAALVALDPPLALLILGAGMEVQWISSAAARQLHLEPDRLVGRSWYELFPAAQAHRAAHEALLGGGLDRVDLPRITLETGSGTPRHYSAQLRPGRTGDGQAVALLVIGADISEQVEAEDALRLSEQRFRAISQHSRDLIIVCSRDGRILYASAALQAVSGVAPADRLGGSVFERLHPDDAAVARARIGKLVKDASLGIATKLELRLSGPDGGWRWIECTAANLLEHPAVGGIVLNCRDITERKQGEAELAAAEARLDTALRTSRTIYWTIDLVADRVTMSRHFFELTGIDRAEWEAERHPWYSRTHPDDYPIVHRAYEDYLAGRGDFYECEYRLHTPAGWLWLQDRGRVAESDAAGRPLVIAGTSQEVGWRKQMEQTLRDAAHDERRRISYELHDGLGQELSGIQFMLTGLATELRREQSAHATEVNLTLALIGQALATTRAISRGLEPANPKSGGLRAALSQLAAELARTHGIAVRFDAPTLPLEGVSEVATDNLFRMCQEALTHLRRSGAQVGIDFTAIATDEALELTITGDSPGPREPPPEDAAANLRVMVYRAKLIGAQVSIGDAPGGGAEVRIRYPLAQRLAGDA